LLNNDKVTGMKLHHGI